MKGKRAWALARLSWTWAGFRGVRTLLGRVVGLDGLCGRVGWLLARFLGRWRRAWLKRSWHGVLEGVVMVEGELRQDVVLSGFGGERPAVPDHLLPGTVSPNGLNIDYRQGTIRKRRGIARVTTYGVYSGGVLVQSRYMASQPPVLETSGNVVLGGTLHTYELVVAPLFDSADGDYQVFRHVTSGSDGTGLWLKDAGTSYRWEARVTHSGGTLAVTQSSGTNPQNNQPQVITVQFNASTGDLALTVAGVSFTGNIGGNTYTQPAGTMRLGGESGSAYHVKAILSDFRVWDGTVASSLQTALRPLTAFEVLTGLEAWWRFLPGEEHEDSKNSYDFTNVVNNVLFGHGFVPGLATFSEIECLVAGSGSSNGWMRVLCGTRRSLHSAAATGSTFTGAIAMGAPSTNYRMQGLRYGGHAIFMNGGAENRIAVYSTGASYLLSFEPPILGVGGLTITAAGSGGGMSAGTYRYLFSIWNTETGVESAVGTVVSDVVAVSNDEVTIDLTTFSVAWERYESGADEIRIYRTEADGGVYYHLADVAIDAASYVDDAADTTLVTRMPTYVGYAAPSRFGFELDDRLWLGNQENNESRLVYTEKFSLGGFYSDNYVDVGSGDGDALTGGVGMADRAVVFKRRSCWLLSSAGGATQVVRLASGVGCVQHATIAASHDAVYFLAEGGVYRLPLGGGTPEALMDSSWQAIFAGMTEEDFEGCSAGWDPITRRYVCSIRVDGVARMLVYTVETQAWALWDGEASGFLYVSGGGVNGLYCGWRNYLAKLDGEACDGMYETLAGTVTSATSTTLTDSTAPWDAVVQLPNQSAGLANVDVTVMDADGGNVQTRTVLHNTTTVLTVDSAWDETPGAGWTYMIGAVEGYWHSPKLALERWDRRGNLNRLRVLNVPLAEEAWAGDGAVVSVAVDGQAAVAMALDPSERYQEFGVAAGMGRELVVSVSDLSSDRSFDVGSLVLPYVPSGGVG